MKVPLKLSALAVFLLTLLLFSRALFCDFVNLDDPQYVYLNPAITVLDWHFIVESFRTSFMGWWMPLTWISFAIDFHFWGLNPLGYHLTNIVLHAFNAALVVLITDNLLKSRLLMNNAGGETCSAGSFITNDTHLYQVTLLLCGLLWGIHPLRVESVVWITERKDVLSGLFSFLAIHCYLRFTLAEHKKVSPCSVCNDYLLSLLFFFLSMLAKPVSVVLPMMFLVLDWYPSGRLRKGNVSIVLLEKLPFFALSLIIAAATLYSATGQTILVSLADYPLYKRFLVAGYALSEYIRMSLYPVGLIHLYVLPITFTPVHFIFTGITLLLAGYCFVMRKKYPWLVATWCLYVLPLLPVLGFFQNGSQSHADRFTYLPLLFPSIAAAVILVTIFDHFRKRSILNGKLFFSLIVAFLILHGAMTFSFIGHWKNSSVLWSRLIAIQPLGRAYYYLAEYYLKCGRYLEAVTEMQNAIRFAMQAGMPDIFNLHALLGDALSRAGRFDEAVSEFSIAIEMNPVPNYFYHRGVALQRAGKVIEAEKDFLTAGSATGPIPWSGPQR